MVAESSSLSGKVAIVTGGAKGIGGGVVRVFAARGAKVVFNDVDEAAGERQAAEVTAAGGVAHFVPGDVTRPDDVRRLVEVAVERHSELHVVVNNAAILATGLPEETSVEEWDHLFHVNVRSIFLTCKYAVPHLRRAGRGAIVNIGSVSSLVGQQGTPAYCASKGAVLMLTKALALDYGPAGIRVNCLMPGVTNTPMLQEHLSSQEDAEGHLRERLARVPTGKLLEPEDLGRAAAFLASDDSIPTNGASLVVDGGYSACAEFYPKDV